jgi:hypothetical protein
LLEYSSDTLFNSRSNVCINLRSSIMTCQSVQSKVRPKIELITKTIW